jgi:nitric oxide reductase NorD protein
MEEYVGGLWHRLVTRAANPRHPQAAVTLEQIAKTAAIFFRALGGDPGLDLSAAPATRHGARRRWLQRIAGSNERIELAWRDGETLRLPQQIDLFPERSLNRDLYLWLVALAAVDNDASQPWITRNQQATLATLQRFPGITARYRRLVQALLPLRLAPEQLPDDEAVQERAIRQALQQPGSVAALPPARRPFQPVPLWPHPAPPVSAAARTAPGDGAPERDQTGQDVARSRRKHVAERTDMPDGKDGFLMMFRAESLFSWTEFIKINRPQDDEEEADNAARAAEDMESLTVARDSQTSAAKLRFDLDLPSERRHRPAGVGLEKARAAAGLLPLAGDGGACSGAMRAAASAAPYRAPAAQPVPGAGAGAQLAQGAAGRRRSRSRCLGAARGRPPRRHAGCRAWTVSRPDQPAARPGLPAAGRPVAVH